MGRRVAAGVVALVLGAAVAGCTGSSAVDRSQDSTSVELAATTAISDDQLDGAADIAGRRLRTAGISGVDVTTTDGGTLLLTGAATALDDAVPLVSARGLLRLRLAVAQASAEEQLTAGAGGGRVFDQAAAKFADWHCPYEGSTSSDTDDAGDYVVACDSRGAFKYLLAPSDLDGSHVESAQASLDPSTNVWLVLVNFDAAGADLFFDLTKRAFEAPSGCPSTPDPAGCNSIAMVLDGTVITAPTSQQDGIPGGATQITGDFTKQTAQQLAAELSGGPMPTSFERR